MRESSYKYADISYHIPYYSCVSPEWNLDLFFIFIRL
jgi:hypothetical protein